MPKTKLVCKPLPKLEAIDRIIGDLEEQHRKLSSMIYMNRYNFNKLVREQTIYKRQRGVITEQIRRLREDMETINGKG